MNKTCANCAVPKPCKRPELLGGRGCEEHLTIGQFAAKCVASEAARTADLIDKEGLE